MTLQEFGAYLTEKREARSLSIRDIANSLKLSPRVVQAMEDINLADLPHPAYVRAFYFSYAGILDIDNELTHTALEELVVESAVDSSSIHIPIKQSGRRLGTLLVLFVFVLALFAIVYAIMSSSIFSDLSSMTSKPKTQKSEQVFSSDITLAEKPKPSTKTVAETSQKMMQASEVSANATAFSTATKKPTESESNPSATSTKKAESVLADNKKAPIAGTDGQKILKPIADATAKLIMPTTQATSPAPKIPATPDKPASTKYLQMDFGTRHTLILTGTSGSWLRVTVGERVRQFTIEKGQVLTVRFDNTAILRLGNAGGVTATFNGKKLPPLGASGEVRTLAFPNS